MSVLTIRVTITQRAPMIRQASLAPVRTASKAMATIVEVIIVLFAKGKYVSGNHVYTNADDLLLENIIILN